MGHLRLNTEPIKLPDGWSGRVIIPTRAAGFTLWDRLSSWSNDAGAPAERLYHKGRDLPTVEQWLPLLSQLITDPTALPGHTVLKYSKHGEVIRAQAAVGDGVIDIICRQSRTPSLGRGVAAVFRRSRESRNFDRAMELLRAGINTAVPLALIERRSPRREAWLLTELVPDLVDLDQVVNRLLPQLEHSAQRRVKDAVLQAIVDLLDRMERHNLAHRDLKASNILLRNWDDRAGRVGVWLVDLDGLRRRGFLHRATGFSLRGRPRPTGKSVPHGLKPAARLAASLLSCTSVTRSDYCRFLRAYLVRRGSSRQLWKQCFRELARQTSNYVRRAQRRKSDKLDGYLWD